MPLEPTQEQANDITRHITAFALDLGVYGEGISEVTRAVWGLVRDAVLEEAAVACETDVGRAAGEGWGAHFAERLRALKGGQ